MPPKKLTDSKDEDEKKKARRIYEEHMASLSDDMLAKILEVMPQKRLINSFSREPVQLRLRTGMKKEDADKFVDVMKTPKSRFQAPRKKKKAEPEDENSDKDTAYPNPPSAKRSKISEKEQERIRLLKEKRKNDEKILAEAKKEARTATTKFNQEAKLAQKQKEKAEQLKMKLENMRNKPPSATQMYKTGSKSPGSRIIADIKAAQEAIDAQNRKVQDAEKVKKAREAAAAAEEARLNAVKINVRRLPVALLSRLESYGIDLAKVQDWNVADIFDDRAAQVLEEVLDILHTWNPTDLIDHIWQLLDSMAIAHQLNRAERAQTLDIEATQDDVEVTRQVRGILKSKHHSHIAFAEQCFWLIRMSERIDRLESSDHNEQNNIVTDNESLPAARTRKQDVYTKYLIQEAGGVAEYNDLLATEQHQHLKRRRTWWKGQKMWGSKLREFIRHLGWGILACLPSSMTINDIDRWNGLHIRAIAHGLTHGPAAKDWQRICHYFEDWLPEYFETGHRTNKVVSKRNSFKETFGDLYGLMQNENQESAKRNMALSIEDILDDWPEGTEVELHGSDFPVVINRENVGSLDALNGTGLIDEAVINGIIAHPEAGTSNPATIVIPAGYMVMDTTNTGFDFQDDSHGRLRSADMIYMPVHHGQGGSGEHWTLVQINRSARTIRYLDSMLSERRASHVNGRIQEWLRVANIIQENDEDFDFQIVRDAEQQENGIDCGIFMLNNLECMLRGSPRSYHTNPNALRRTYAGRLLRQLRRSQEQTQRLAQADADSPRAIATAALAEVTDNGTS